MEDNNAKDQSPQSPKTAEELNRELITILEGVIKGADWDSTLFLKSSIKPVKALHEKAKALLEETEHGKHEARDQKNQGAAPPLKAGYVVVYISLYQSDGANLAKWHDVIDALAGGSVGRPSYATEESVQAVIRSKANSDREGYIQVHVKEKDILKPNEVARDRLGNELLTLQEGAVKLASIVEFVHGNRDHYRLKNGRLIPSGPPA